MKATLEFELPEDGTEFELAANAQKWYTVAWDLDQWLRSQTKYSPDSMHEEYYKALQDTRDKLKEIISEEGLSLG